MAVAMGSAHTQHARRLLGAAQYAGVFLLDYVSIRPQVPENIV